MDSPSASPPAQRYITSHAHLLQRKAAREAAAFNALVLGNFADFPTRPTDQYPLIDQMKAAMRDESDILDNPDNNAHINRIRATSDEDLEEKAWELMFDAYDVQRGKRIPKLSTAYFPNYLDRFDALVALMRTKLSNNHSNKLREFNKDVKAAAKFSGRTTTAEDGTTRIYDVAGNLVKEFRRPEKRPLSELLGDRLASIARPKRARTRTASGPTSSNSTNSSTPEEPVVDVGGSLTPIQEEGGDVEGATDEEEERPFSPVQGTEEDALGKAEKDDGNAAFRAQNRFSTPSADACNSHFDDPYPRPDQSLLLNRQSSFTNQDPTSNQNLSSGKQSHHIGQYPTPDQNLLLGEQSYVENQHPTADQNLLSGEHSYINNQHLMAIQHPPFGQQPYSSDQFPTPDQHEAVGEQSEHDSPDDYPASPSYEVDLLGESSGEDDGGQAPLDGGGPSNDRDRIGY
ncbi:hypothetical protein QBC45DRAFT_373942 [Copromyces sp. CBS 386.78]|nr:hypothetical protein QBC45DRAFT_373942 [Copromyces sp. CBS 386.78]